MMPSTQTHPYKSKYYLVRRTLCSSVVDPIVGNTLQERSLKRLKQQLGPYAIKTMDLSMRKNAAFKQMYSMSFVAAITQSQLLCSEIIEGAHDATLFEDLLFKMLSHIRSDEQMMNKSVVLLMDNASFHHHSQVLSVCQKMKVNVLFNAQYSPWLNPIEQLFNTVKRRLLKRQVNTK